MTDVVLVKQGEVAGFVYTKDNLADTVKPLLQFGQNIIETLSKNKGALNPIYAPDPITPNKVNIVDTTRAAPELGEVAFRERMRRETYNFLERKFNQDCNEIMILKIDDCDRKDDLNSWYSLIVIDKMRLNNIAHEALGTFDGSNNIVEMTGTFNHQNWERILPIKFQEFAGDEILAEGIDVIYFDAKSCGNCSTYSEGCNKIAVLTVSNSGSPGLSSQFVYTVNAGSIWTVVDISSLGGKSGTAMTGVGSYFLVVSETDGAHHYAPKSNPSSSSWIRVNTGYVGGGSPRCIYVKDVSNVFIGGQGGYIYKSTDITASVTVLTDGTITAQNANAIHGVGETVVSVHDSNVVLYSANSGGTFSLVTGPENGANLLAVWAVSPFQWYVGTSTGKLWFTTDRGANWTQRQLPNQASLTEVWDIVFAEDLAEIGYVAVQTTSTTGLVYRTVTGGRSWFSDAPGIDELPVQERIRALASCGVNEVVAVGKKSGSTDGVVAIAR